MGLDGLHRDLEAQADLLVEVAARDVAKDLALAGGELVELGVDLLGGQVPGEGIQDEPREALTNAAKFASDGGPVRLYAEIEAEWVKVFVDDRGPGFDSETLPADRRGISESIIGRMERHGGRAEIRTGTGEGTEVELTLDRRNR